jgi:hypothetical protein
MHTAGVSYSWISSRHGHIIAVLYFFFLAGCYMIFVCVFHLLWTLSIVGESPSSSASDIDNLNNSGLSKGPSGKDANSPQVAGNNLLITVRNQPHLTRLLAYVSSKGVFIHHVLYLVLPPFLFTCHRLVQKWTSRRQVKRNGGSMSHPIRVLQSLRFISSIFGLMLLGFL